MSSEKAAAPDFADSLIPHSSKVNFLSNMDKVIDWRPIEKLLKKGYKRGTNATGKPAYPALPMFKALCYNVGIL